MLNEFWPDESDWTPRLQSFFASATWADLEQFINEQRREHAVYPAPRDIFRAFRQPGFAKTRIVILGQDPYHGEGQAHGLSFSVPSNVKLPPSLRNIYKELQSDLGHSPTVSGDLSSWAKQGVFLLNTVLTVNASQAHSHRNRGWEAFTDHVIEQLNDHPRSLIFLLWGKPAQKKSRLIDDRHHILSSPHPSPLSAHRGFFGSRPFSKTNQILEQLGEPPIDWKIPDD